MERNFSKASLIIFGIALIVRLAFILAAHPYRDLERYELERTAISLATNGVYGNPYAIPTGPTAHVSPGYTLVLAGLFRIFGTGTRAEIIKELLSSVVTSFSCSLLPWVAVNLRFGRNAGIVAGLFSALLPLSPLVQIDGDWEAPYTALSLMLICVISNRVWRDRLLSSRRAALHGLCWGVVLLFVSALAPLFLVLLVAGSWFCRKAGLRRYLVFACIEALVAAACLAPWAIRNEIALGAPVWTRTNFGLELRVSNNDFATPDQRVNYLRGVYHLYHPLQSPTEAAKVRDMGEIAYNQKAANTAKAWIVSHPSRFVQLCLGRARCFWFYPDPSRMKAILLGLVMVFGFAGLIYFWTVNWKSATLITLVLIIYPLPNYLVHVGVRQQYPIDWIMALLGAALILRWGRKWIDLASPVENSTTVA